MRSSIPFDTHAYVKRLTAAGMPEEQAEVQAQTLADLVGELVHERLATKDDLERLRAELQHDLEATELRLKHELTLRLGAMMAAAVAIVAVLARLL